MTQLQPHNRASRAAKPGFIGLAVAALAVAGTAAWLYGRTPATEAPAQPAAQAPLLVPLAAASAPATAAPAPVSAASAIPPVVRGAAGASAPAWEAAASAAIEKMRSPAEALRKVQVALNGGTPAEVLEAAHTLQQCSWSAGGPEAMDAMRDRYNEMPEAMKKVTDSLGGINKMIDQAQSEARRCQVFDPATLGRRMELFQRAYEGGAEGAAVAYLMALQSPFEKQKPDAALVAQLQADIRNAATAGETVALQYLGGQTPDRARELGITPVQAAGYQAAWKLITDERFPGTSAIIEKATAAFRQPSSAPALSAAEQAEANAVAQQILDTWRRNRKGG
jgi:hypothetical protein